MRVATDNAWWHPGIVLAGLSAITLLSALVAVRVGVNRFEPEYQRTKYKRPEKNHVDYATGFVLYDGGALILRHM
jgi:hypothetical protein